MVCHEGSAPKWIVYHNFIGIDLLVLILIHLCSRVFNRIDIEWNVILRCLCLFYAGFVNDFASFSKTSSIVFEITDSFLYFAMGTDGGTINNMIEKTRLEGSLWSG